MNKILILAGDSTYNRGDRGNMASQIDILKKKITDVHITIESYKPKTDSIWFEADAIIEKEFRGIFKFIKCLKNTDLVIWGGGALLQDNASKLKIPYWCFRILLAKLFKKPVMAWAQGVGPFQTKLGSSSSKFILNKVDLITVRDETSLNVIKKIGVRKTPVFLTADPALALLPSRKDKGLVILKDLKLNESDKIAGVALSFASFHYSKSNIIPYKFRKKTRLTLEWDIERCKKFQKIISKVIDYIIENFKMKVVLIPMYVAPWESDFERINEIRNMSFNKDKISILTRDYHPKVFLSFFRFFDFFMAVPMHSTIFASIMNVPTINIFYETKGRDFFTRLGATDQMIDIYQITKDNGYENLINKIEYVIENKEKIKIDLEIRMKELRETAITNGDFARDILVKSNKRKVYKRL